MSETHSNTENSGQVELPSPVAGKASATFDTSSPTTAVLANLKMFQDEEHADLSVKCHKTQWKCHKAVVFARCLALQQMETDGVIELPKKGLEAIEALLVWLYTLDYDTTKKVIHACSKTGAGLFCAIDLVILAAEMDLPSLAKQARGSYAELFRDYVENAVSPSGWEGAEVVRIGDVVSAMKFMYGAEAPAAVVDTRACVMQHLADNAGRLLQDGEFVDLLRSQQALMVDLMMQLVLVAMEKLGG